MTTDIIDRLAGVVPGSPVDNVRRRRAQARTHSQASYDALFAAPDGTGVSQVERLAIAAFVAALHNVPAARTHYRELLARAGGTAFADLVDATADAAAGQGPWGRFPASADLRAEDEPGQAFFVDAAGSAALGQRLTRALEHAHLLVFRPRESSPDSLVSLQGAGWSTPAIITISQLVAFLSFQLRVIHGLRVLEESQS